MERALIKQYDRTTAGGIVMEGIEDMEHNGTPLSFMYAKVWCPVCKTNGMIIPHGERSHDFTMGRNEPALHLDISRCACEPNPRVVASQGDMTMRA
jgi:uncharacterized Zn-binding protein involved in type VI secretion